MEIKIRNLTKRYGEKTVWADLSLDIPIGSGTALMGASGCGKTTLLRILMGLERQDSGTVQGVPSNISAVFQEDRLCQEFTAVENIEMVMQTHNTREKIVEHLARLGLEDSLNQPVETLSGGMKRRVAIARAYLAPSEIVFLDEPLKGLDEDTKAEVLSWMKEMGKKRTVLLVTHDREEARVLTERIVDLGNLGKNCVI